MVGWFSWPCSDVSCMERTVLTAVWPETPTVPGMDKPAADTSTQTNGSSTKCSIPQTAFGFIPVIKCRCLMLLSFEGLFFQLEFNACGMFFVLTESLGLKGSFRGEITVSIIRRFNPYPPFNRVCVTKCLTVTHH